MDPSRDGASRPDPLTMSVAEAARFAGIGRSRMYQLVKVGQVRHLRVGTKIRIPRDAVTEWVEREAATG